MKLALALLFSLPLAGQNVKLAPYYTPGVGSQDITTAAGTDTSMLVVNSGSMTRTLMPYAATINQISVPLADVSSLTAVTPVTLTCTANAANLCTTWTAHYGTDITVGFVANSLNTFTLGTPLTPAANDATGVLLTFSQPHATNLALLTAQLFPAIAGSQGTKTLAETCYTALNVGKPATITQSALNSGLIANAGCPVIGYYGPPPTIAGIGDSIIAGAPAPGRSIADTFAMTYPIPATLPPQNFWFKGYNGGGSFTGPYGSGWSGQTAVQIAARITDLTSLSPTYALSNGGVNDLSGCDTNTGCTGGQITAIETALTTIMSSVQAAGIKLFIMLIGPWNTANGSNARHVSGDTINAFIIANAGTYGATVIDWTCVLGKFRAGTSNPNNCWDFQAAYLQGDGLGIHPNQAGAKIIGEMIFGARGKNIAWTW